MYYTSICLENLTNSIEMSRTADAAISAVIQTYSNILWNQEVRYCSHKSHPLVPIRSRINPVLTTPFYLECVLILSTQMRLGLPSLFLSDFSTKILYTFIFSFVLHALTTIFSLTWSFSHTRRRAQVTKFLIMQFPAPSSQFIPFRTKYSPQHSLRSSLNTKEQVPHTYWTTAKL
jgi:hypothetical protein